MTHFGTDYDIAILGGSTGSRLAALMAAQQGARVALIAPVWQENDVSRSLWQSLQLPDLRSMDLPVFQDWVNYQGEHPGYSPAVLRTQGIDVILEPVSFTRHLDLELSDRLLKASRYLLTDGYGRSINCSALLALETPPEKIFVTGRGASAVEWAYALSRLAQVTLLLQDPVLLPAEDRDIQRLVGAQLKSLGIDVVCNASEDDSAALVGDQLVVAIPSPFDWTAAGLENLGICPYPSIPVNAYLQASCSQIYVSGASLGGENRPELTQQETQVALANALFGRWRRVGYDQIFYSIALLSPVARWGLTERQARRCYGDGIQIFQAACLPMTASHGAQTNFCKLITCGPRVVGLHLMGEGAQTMAATLGKHLTMATLGKMVAGTSSGTLWEAVHQAIAQWRSTRWREGQWRRDWAENWFNLRRSV